MLNKTKKFLTKGTLLILSCSFLCSGSIKNSYATEQTVTKAPKESLQKNIQNEKPIEVLLFLSLPAGGKSEIRKYLSNISSQNRLDGFKVGPMVQLDDFPYVWMMRRISEELEKRGQDPIFYLSSALPLTDPRDWGMLVHLLNEDYEDIVKQRIPTPVSAALYLFDRLDKARIKVGGDPKLSKLPKELRLELAKVLEKEASALLQEKNLEIERSLAYPQKTIVIEFSRGGAEESKMPLPEPYGYKYSLSQLSNEILEKAKILYLKVSPDESRTRNSQRFDPKNPSSSLHHYVPMTVMHRDYGCDDLEYLNKISDKPNTVKIVTNGKSYYLPVTFFDNHSDHTTFSRSNTSDWKKEDTEKFRTALKKAFDKLNAAKS